MSAKKKAKKLGKIAKARGGLKSWNARSHTRKKKKWGGIYTLFNRK